MEPLEGYGMNPIPIIPPTMVNMRIERPQNEQILHISPLNHGFWYCLVLYLSVSIWVAMNKLYW